MSSVNIRHRPKMTAIPRPIQANHKSRQYHQLKTTKPKGIWSEYNVLPAIGATELDEFIKNESDIYDTEPTRYDDISDSEFLYDQMTAESDEMIKREAAIKIIHEKAYLQFLELKSDYVDWVIQMAHKDIWIPVKFTELSGKVSIPQSPVTDDPGKYVPSSPSYSKDISQGRDDPDVLTPKPSSCDKEKSASQPSPNRMMHKPPAYPKDQTPNRVNMNQCASDPPAHTKDQIPNNTSTNQCAPKPPHFLKDLTSDNVSKKSFLPKPPAIPKCLPASCTLQRKENIEPKRPGYHKVNPASGVSATSSEPTSDASPKDQPANNPGNENVVPNSAAQQKDQLTNVIGATKFMPQPPTYPIDKSSRRSKPVKFMTSPIAGPNAQYDFTGSPDPKMSIPSPPGKLQDSNRNSRNIRRPDRFRASTIPSANTSPIPESTIDLALI